MSMGSLICIHSPKEIFLLPDDLHAASNTLSLSFFFADRLLSPADCEFFVRGRI